jgi:CheY-like chemotaxis protein
VADAGNLNEALALIDQQMPDIVISDIDLPERSGLELLGELGRRRARTPVVFVSGYLNAYRSQIPQHADVEVLEKPVSIEELRGIVQRRLGQRVERSEAAPFGVADYLQLASMGRHSVVIEIERGARALGRIVVSEGEVFSAGDVLGEGQAALARLAFAERSTVRCKALTEPPRDRNMSGNWEFALLEAARIADESKSRGRHARDPYELDAARTDRPERIASAQAPPAAEPAPAVDDVEFNAAWDAGVDALLKKRYGEALSAFLRAKALRPDDRKVEVNIRRLAELGFVETPQPSRGTEDGDQDRALK